MNWRKSHLELGTFQVSQAALKMTSIKHPKIICHLLKKRPLPFQWSSSSCTFASPPRLMSGPLKVRGSAIICCCHCCFSIFSSLLLPVELASVINMTDCWLTKCLTQVQSLSTCFLSALLLLKRAHDLWLRPKEFSAVTDNLYLLESLEYKHYWVDQQ